MKSSTSLKEHRSSGDLGAVFAVFPKRIHFFLWLLVFDILGAAIFAADLFPTPISVPIIVHSRSQPPERGLVIWAIFSLVPIVAIVLALAKQQYREWLLSPEPRVVLPRDADLFAVRTARHTHRTAVTLVWFAPLALSIAAALAWIYR